MHNFYSWLLCICLLLSFTGGGSRIDGADEIQDFRHYRVLGLQPTPIPYIKRDAQGTAVAWIVFGGVTMMTVTFYLISSKDAAIREATWLVVSNAVALFCAILLFLAFRELVALITQGEDIQSRRRLGGSEISDWQSGPLRQLAGGSYDQCWGSSSSSSASSASHGSSASSSHSSSSHSLSSNSHSAHGSSGSSSHSSSSHSHSSESHLAPPLPGSTDSGHPRRLALPPTQETLIIDTLCLVVVFLAWELILWLVRRTMYGLPGLGLIAAHCMGFAALYTFGNLQQCEPFRKRPQLSVLITVLGFVSLIIFSRILNTARQLYGHWYQRRHGCEGGDPDSHIDHEHAWGHQCEHTEREAVSFAVGYLISQFLKHVSRGALAPIHDVPKGHDIIKSNDELLFGLGLSIVVIVFGYVEHKIAERDGNAHIEDVSGAAAPESVRLRLISQEKEFSGRKSNWSNAARELFKKELRKELQGVGPLHLWVVCIKDSVAFAVGWVSLDYVKIVFWSSTDDKGILGDGDIMTSQVVMVVVSFIISFSVFFILHFTAKCVNAHLARGLRALCRSFMLLLGLAWEGAFWEGAHNITLGLQLESRPARMSMVVVEGALFVAIVLPAWIMFILPHTLKIHGGEVHMMDYDDVDSPKAHHEMNADEANDKLRASATSEKDFNTVVGNACGQDDNDMDFSMFIVTECEEASLKNDIIKVGANGARVKNLQSR